MKKLLFTIGTLCAILISSCTNQGKYTYQIPDSLIVDADTATIIPAYQKKIGDTKVVCYIVDTCRRTYNYSAQITMREVGNPILTENDIFAIQLAKIENDSFSISFPEMVGTGRFNASIPLSDSTGCDIDAYIEPGKINNIWIDITKPYGQYGDFYAVYSDNAYNAINNAINKPIPYFRDWRGIPENKYIDLNKKEFIEMVMHQHDSIIECINKDSIASTIRYYNVEYAKYETYRVIEQYNYLKEKLSKRKIAKHEYISSEELQKVYNELNFLPQSLFYPNCNEFLNDTLIDLKDYPADVYSMSQLARLCDKFDENLWKDAPEDAADFIGDEFCIAAYKHYRTQCIEAHKRAEGVFAEETPNVADAKLFSSMMQKYKGRPTIVYFWSALDSYSLYDLRINKDNQSADTTYVYIANSWSSKSDWNKTINHIKGSHYFISNESFNYILKKFGNKHGMIPFKLYLDENGKTYSYEDRTPLDPEAKENKRPVYIEEVPNVTNDSLISAIVEKHKGKPTIIDFWGVHCIHCMKEISIKEKTKTDDVNYIYITCTADSPQNKWEETIKDISGYHYYISTDVFYSILESYQTSSIPFKLYYSADGKLENTVVGAEY